MARRRASPIGDAQRLTGAGCLTPVSRYSLRIVAPAMADLQGWLFWTPPLRAFGECDRRTMSSLVPTGDLAETCNVAAVAGVIQTGPSVDHKP